MSKIRPTDITIESAVNGAVLVIDNGKPVWKTGVVGSGGGGSSGGPVGYTKLRKTAVQAIATGDWRVLSWDTADYDNLGTFTNPTTITVPAGVTLMRAAMTLNWGQNSNDGRFVTMYAVADMRTLMGDMRNARNETLTTLNSGWVRVVPGEQLRVQVNSGSQSLDLGSAGVYGYPELSIEWATNFASLVTATSSGGTGGGQGGGGSSNASAPAYRYWIITNMASSINTGALSAAKLTAEDSLGTNLPITAISSKTSYDGSTAANNLIDNDDASIWANSGGANPSEYLLIDFGTPVSPASFNFKSRSGVNATQTPYAFDLYAGGDSVVYNLVGGVSRPQSSFTGSTVYRYPFARLDLAGGGGATSLSDLADVDLTNSPQAGQALVWNADIGKFVPGTVASGSNGGGQSDGGSGSTDGPTGLAWVVVANGTGSSQSVELPVSGLTNKDVLVFVNGIRWATNEYSINAKNLVLTTRVNDNIAIWFAGASGTNFAYGGGRVSVNAATALSTIATLTPINWTTEQRDTDAFWIVGAPARFTIPAGVSKVRLSASIALDSGTVDSLTFMKNGVKLLSGGAQFAPGVTASTDVLDVATGDYFSLGYIASGSATMSTTSWFAVEVIERNISATGVSIPVRNLLDVNAAAPANGDCLVFDSALQRWVAKPATVSVNSSGTNVAFKGAMAILTADKATTNSGYVPWDGTDYDTDGFWSAAAPTRLTIPAGKGIKKVRLSMALNPANSDLSGNQYIAFGKGGSTAFRGANRIGVPTGYADSGLASTGPVIAVVDGDYFEAYYGSTDTARTWQAARCYFSIEVVERTI